MRILLRRKSLVAVGNLSPSDVFALKEAPEDFFRTCVIGPGTKPGCADAVRVDAETGEDLSPVRRVPFRVDQRVYLVGGFVEDA